MCLQITVDTDRTVVAFYKFLKKHASIPFKLQKPTSTSESDSKGSSDAKESQSSDVKDELWGVKWYIFIYRNYDSDRWWHSDWGKKYRVTSHPWSIKNKRGVGGERQMRGTHVSLLTSICTTVGNLEFWFWVETSINSPLNFTFFLRPCVIINKVSCIRVG